MPVQGAVSMFVAENLDLPPPSGFQQRHQQTFLVGGRNLPSQFGNVHSESVHISHADNSLLKALLAMLALLHCWVLHDFFRQLRIDSPAKKLEENEATEYDDQSKKGEQIHVGDLFLHYADERREE